MSFNVDLLLSSKNFSLIAEGSPSLRPEREDETAIWKDSLGPLWLGRIGPESSRHFRLHFDDDLAVDVLDNRHLVVRAQSSVPKNSIDHFLADQVIPRVIAHEGQLVLHAGAITHAESAILLLGASGRGKSTLASSFHFNGSPLLGDDAVTISQEGIPTATAIYPSLRLFPDSIEALFQSDVPTEDIAHYSHKQRISVLISTDTKPCTLPINSIFVLEEETYKTIGITRLSIADACMALVENSFSLDPTDPQRARGRLEAASNLAGQVPAFAVSYPRDYARLPEVRDAILGALRR